MPQFVLTMEPIVYEYHEELRNLRGGDTEITITELNTLGAEGWELVQIVTENDIYTYYFKRPTYNNVST